MKKRWILALALLAAPMGLSADEPAGARLEKATLTTPVTAKTAPAPRKKKVKKAARKPGAVKPTEGAVMVKEEGAPVPKNAKKWYCTMDGYESDTAGECPKCGMDLVKRK